MAIRVEYSHLRNILSLGRRTTGIEAIRSVFARCCPLESVYSRSFHKRIDGEKTFSFHRNGELKLHFDQSRKGATTITVEKEDTIQSRYEDQMLDQMYALCKKRFIPHILTTLRCFRIQERGGASSLLDLNENYESIVGESKVVDVLNRYLSKEDKKILIENMAVVANNACRTKEEQVQKEDAFVEKFIAVLTSEKLGDIMHFVFTYLLREEVRMGLETPPGLGDRIDYFSDEFFVQLCKRPAATFEG